MRGLVTAAILLSCTAMAGCGGPNFMVYKNSKHFYVTSNGQSLRTVLCDSGDMDRIARDSNLPEKLQQEIKGEICASKKVKERLLATLEGMSPEQRKDLKMAFRKNDYDINVVANC
jgi:hypothetical protein